MCVLYCKPLYIRECVDYYSDTIVVYMWYNYCVMHDMDSECHITEAVWTQSLVNFTGLHMDQLAPYCVNIYSYW